MLSQSMTAFGAPLQAVGCADKNADRNSRARAAHSLHRETGKRFPYHHSRKPPSGASSSSTSGKKSSIL